MLEIQATGNTVRTPAVALRMAAGGAWSRCCPWSSWLLLLWRFLGAKQERDQKAAGWRGMPVEPNPPGLHLKYSKGHSCCVPPIDMAHDAGAERTFMVTDRYNESGDSLQLYMQEIEKTPLLTREEEIKLASQVKRGNQRAREQMIKANLRLVVKISYDYANFGMPLLDLINEGNIGLMKAVERFNPKKGAKLSTYAALWIKQSIRRALSNQSKTIRLPAHVVDKVHKLHRASLTLTEALGHEPSAAELATHLGISTAKVTQLRTFGVSPISLDAPIGDEDDNRFSDIVQDEGALTPYELLRVKTMRQEIRQYLK
jgi:RNA polymerase primary sigma factor